MNDGEKILIVGSLPPTPSDAALLTHMLAESLHAASVETVVLIDEMSVPPQAAAYKVVRPYDPNVRQGAFENWPRLHVLGNKPDSLPVLDQLERANGAAIVADRNLFDLGCQWLAIKPDGDKKLRTWLTDKLGVAGSKLASAILHHRRQSNAIGQEIDGYDLLLSYATQLIPVSPSQKISFEQSNLGCAATPLLHYAAKTTLETSNEVTNFAIVGLPEVDQPFITSELSKYNGVTYQFLDRFSAQTGQALKAAHCLVVLDGANTVFCPLAALATSQNKPIICADQPWLANVPSGNILPISHAAALRELVHAILHMHSHGNRQELAQARPVEAIQTILETAKTSQPLKLLASSSLEVPSTKKTPKMDRVPTDAEGAWPLVGAVPSRAILASEMPGITPATSPRFLTPALANYLSELVEEPVLRLSDYLGFENPIMDADDASLSPGAETKRKQWEDIASGLRSKNAPIAFGCAFEQALSPANTVDCVEAKWSFSLPAAVLEKRGPTKQYDNQTNTFWKYDSARSHVIVLFLTGGSGNLNISTHCEKQFLISDGHGTQVIVNKKDIRCQIHASGVACLKLAAIPDENGNMPDIRSMLSKYQLTFTWTRS